MTYCDFKKAKQDAEWLAGSEADTAERNLARAYLALREQVATLTADRDAWEVACHNATIEKHEQLAALRDAIRAEAIHESAMNDDEMRTQLRIRAERAEQMLAERDAEIERLRKDAARLDWLDANPIDVFYDSYRTKGWSVGYRMDYEVRGIRSALDAAAQGNLFGGAV